MEAYVWASGQDVQSFLLRVTRQEVDVADGAGPAGAVLPPPLGELASGQM